MINIVDIMRTGHVKRWQIVRTARVQTLAEHSYCVAMLAHHIYWLLFDTPNPQEETLLLLWALRHDVPEVITGDIAAPLKQRLRALEHDPLTAIEYELDPEYERLREGVRGTVIGAIVKLADLLESAVFIDMEGLGEHARMVRAKLIDQYARERARAAERFPDVPWWRISELLNELLRGHSALIDIEQEDT